MSENKKPTLEAVLWYRGPKQRAWSYRDPRDMYLEMEVRTWGHKQDRLSDGEVPVADLHGVDSWYMGNNHPCAEADNFYLTISINRYEDPDDVNDETGEVTEGKHYSCLHFDLKCEQYIRSGYNLKAAKSVISLMERIEKAWDKFYETYGFSAPPEMRVALAAQAMGIKSCVMEGTEANEHPEGTRRPRPIGLLVQQIIKDIAAITKDHPLEV